jgi:hypothetical protein
MLRSALLGLAAFAFLVLPGRVFAQARQFPLESMDGARLQLHNVVAEPATHQGKKCLRLTLAPKPAPAGAGPADLDHLAVIEGLELANGVIEVELAGAPAPGAFEGARGFVGIAFRVQPDKRTYDAFYLRPTNGRAEDQERRNRSAQYISRPDWPWARLRKETPAKYESYVDLVPGAWTKVKIEVKGDRARLFVHDSEQPTLMVNDVKSGASAKGGVALWLDAGTVAHFRNLTLTPEPDKR